MQRDGAGGTMAWQVKIGGDGDHTLLLAAVCVLAFLTLIWWAPRVPRVLPVRWVERMGRRSIAVYLVHWPWMIILLRITGQLGGWTGFLILTVSSLILTAVIIALWPLTRWLFELPGRPTAAEAGPAHG